MKLRNKKTGQIIETKENYFYMTFSNNVQPKDGFTSIKNFNEIWEDYTPTEPLIKDEKIRKAVRAWAEANDYKKCKVCVYDYDRAGVFCKGGITSFIPYETNLPITFFNININIIPDKPYTIAELCGEED